MQTIVLDACALIAYMRNEKGAELVHKELHSAKTRPLMHAINLYEVYYDTYRQQPGLAHLVPEFAKKAGIEIFQRTDHRLMEEAAILKTSFQMSLADSVACGLARKLGATLLTADQHEFGEVEKVGVVKIKFIR
jgi:PIN domain nuclease of toxin-antitoxin system